MAHTIKYFLLTVLCAVFIVLLIAPVQSGAQLATPDYSGSLWTRSTLTGPWGCARNELAKKGITFKASVTQIYQGNFTDGSNDDKYWRNSGVADYEMDLDIGKLGLWPGGFLKVRGMSNYRKSINSQAGSIMPVNSVCIVPLAGRKLYRADGFSVHAVSIGAFRAVRRQDEHPGRRRKRICA